VGQIGIHKAVLLPGKKFNVDADLVYDDAKKNIAVNKSTLELNKSEFNVTGDYQFKTKDHINVSIEGKNTDIQTVLSLFPEEATKKWKQYRSKGEIYFSLSLKGEISETRSPFISVSFGCKQASFFHPDYKSKVEEANLEGSFAAPNLTDLSRAELFLKDISGKLNDQPFTANFSLQDFEDPYVSLDFKGGMEASSLLNFYPIENAKDVRGALEADISFDGKISLLKNRNTAQQIQTEGSVELKDISFVLGSRKIQFNHWSGALQFNKNDI